MGRSCRCVSRTFSANGACDLVRHHQIAMGRTPTTRPHASGPKRKRPVNKRLLFAFAIVGGAVTGKLALSHSPTWQALAAGGCLGVLLAMTVVLYAKWRAPLGRMTVWAAISCVWGAVFAAVGATVPGCPSFSCRAGTATGFAGAGALTIFSVAMVAGMAGMFSSGYRFARRLLRLPFKPVAAPSKRGGSKSSKSKKRAARPKKRTGRR